jgi:hypothetical protein
VIYRTENQLLVEANKVWLRRNLSQILAFGVTLFSLITIAPAQDYEYGDPEDLKGLTKYYVETRGDVKVRKKIVEAISKKLPNLFLTDEQANSEIRLDFFSELQDGLKGGADGWGGFLKLCGCRPGPVLYGSSLEARIRIGRG